MPYTWDGWTGYRDARGGVGTNTAGFKQSNLGTGVAIDRTALQNTVLNPVSNQPYNSYAIHPQLPFLHQQFNNHNLAFVANVGTMIEPSTITEWQQETMIIKLFQLYSLFLNKLVHAIADAPAPFTTTLIFLIDYAKAPLKIPNIPMFLFSCISQNSNFFSP